MLKRELCENKVIFLSFDSNSTFTYRDIFVSKPSTVRINQVGAVFSLKLKKNKSFIGWINGLQGEFFFASE